MTNLFWTKCETNSEQFTLINHSDSVQMCPENKAHKYSNELASVQTGGWTENWKSYTVWSTFFPQSWWSHFYFNLKLKMLYFLDECSWNK